MAKLVVLIALAILGRGINCKSTASDTAFGFEILLAKLEYLEGKLIEVQANQVETKMQMLQTKRQLSEQTGILTNLVEQQAVLEKNKPLQAFLQGKLAKSCKQHKTPTSGPVWLIDYGFEVYCEQEMFGGGWTVFQNRFDGSLSFDQNWTNYKAGFGDFNGEFWLGLEKIHRLTSSKPHQLLVYMKDFKGVYKYIRFDEFAIGSEGEYYDLKTIDAGFGTVASSFSHPKGRKFVTHDRDNAQGDAKRFKSGWWFGIYYPSNLNGVIENTDSIYAMVWWAFDQCYCGLSVSKMMIREIE